jgi:hypothetical protein
MPAVKYWDTGSGQWKKASIGAGYETAPIGTVNFWSGATMPDGWVRADGTRYTQAAFPQGYNFAKAQADAGNTLWTYRTSDTTFTVPDLADRFLLSSGTRTLGVLSQTNPALANPGEESHTLSSVESGQKAVSTGGQSQNHQHGLNGGVVRYPGLVGAPGSSYMVGADSLTATDFADRDHTHAISGTPAQSAHNNMPPYAVLALMVKVAGITIDGSVIVGQDGAAGAQGGQSYSMLIGDAVNTSFIIPHGFNTRDVTVSVYRTAPPYDEILCDVERTGLSSVTIRTLPTVPAVGEYTAVVAAPGTQATLNITMDPWHTVGAAGEPAFGAGFALSGVQPVQFRKSPDGKVLMRGYLSTPAAGGTVFTLPTGYRPPANYVRFNLNGTNAGGSVITAFIYIDVNGVVTLTNTNAPVNVDLSVIEFDTDTVLQTASVAAQPLDAWHLVGAAGEPVFGGAPSWSNYTPAGTFNPVGFRKDPTGRVNLKGLAQSIVSSTAGIPIFTLPVGYRPPRALLMDAQRNDIHVRVDIGSDGRILCAAGLGTNEWCSLDNLSFDTETVGAYATGVLGPPIVTSLPTNPIDGQECYYLADATNGIMWRFRYRAASSSAYKWEFVGGGWLRSASSGVVQPNATSYTDIGINITLPLSGDYIGRQSGRGGSTVAGNNRMYTRLGLAGGGTQPSNDMVLVTSVSTSNDSTEKNFNNESVFLNCVAGGSIRYQCMVNGAYSFYIAFAAISLQPVRVG